MDEDDFTNFDATLSLEDPVADYTKIKEKIRYERYVDDDVFQEMFHKLAASARETVWKLLFVEQASNKENTEKAAKLLEIYRSDACFYYPYDYNDWIGSVRDELLRRKMIDFWKNVIVKGELGPCWVRDCDLFDDLEDPEPANFYKYAGCVPPFSEEALESNSDVDQIDNENNSQLPTETASDKSNLSSATALFAAQLQNQLEKDPDDQSALEVIFKDARNGIWQLLFAYPVLSQQNYHQAAELLESYKREACIFSPFEYNKWILKLRDELFARKYLQFWKEIVVGKKCGLCWHKDSEYFDDPEDTAPLEFYKSGDDLLKKEGI